MESTVPENGADNQDINPDLNPIVKNNRHKKILTILGINLLALIFLSASAGAIIYVKDKQKHNKLVKAELTHSQFLAEIDNIESQNITITVAGKKYTLTKSDITSFLDSSKFSSNQISVNQDALNTYLIALGNKAYVKPVDEVKLSHDDGTGILLSAGVNGVHVDSTSISKVANQITDSLMNNTSLTATLDTTTLPFSTTSSPTNYDYLIEANITTKRMYAYQNGVLLKTFLIDAGKPSTPTPIGTFKVLYKVPIMNMTDNATYFQPNVQWILFFDKNGHSIHGNYWRPLSAFGNLNTSHGCIGVVNSDAEWIYDWAPVGTTIVTYY